MQSIYQQVVTDVSV